MGENLFLGIFAKAYSHNIHVRHFNFGQCEVIKSVIIVLITFSIFFVIIKENLQKVK